jgi:hypothetical protein
MLKSGDERWIWDVFGRISLLRDAERAEYTKVQVCLMLNREWPNACC